MTYPQGQQGGFPQQPGAQGQFPAQQPMPGAPPPPQGQQPPPMPQAPGQQPGSGSFPAQQPGAQPGPQGFGGQQPYGAQQGYGPPMGGGAPMSGGYASWGKRVGAYLIDFFPPQLLLFIALILLFSGALIAGLVVLFIGDLGILIWTIMNRWVQAGKTGQSLGRKVAGISLVAEQTGQPVGPGNAFVRDLAHFLDGIACYVGYLFPLWDVKAQTFADKMMHTIVIEGPPGGGNRGPAGAGQQSFGAPPAGFGGPPMASGGFPAQQPAQPGQFGQPSPYGQPPQPGQYGQPPQQW